MDIVETSFRVVDGYCRKQGYLFGDAKLSPDAAITELNIRFREHGVGYQFETGQINRVDSQLLHAEVVKPALALLADKKFRAANEEFLSAHAHYRHGRYCECLNEALKAFESTMKIICAKRSWSYDQKDTAKTLIDHMLKNGLIPAHLTSHFTGLRTTLESGLPTTRNRLSGHGRGVADHDVPDYIASYALHLTATNILLLVEADKAK